MSLRGALLLVAGLLALTPAADATSTPGPEPTVQESAADVPADVRDWFREQGQEAAAELGDPEGLTVGSPRQVAEWDEAYVAGDQLTEPARPVEEWLAPVTREAEDAPEPVGVVRASAPGGTDVQLVGVTDDAELAAALRGGPNGAVFVFGEGVEGWFGVADGEVWPVDEGARTVLQGSLPAAVFQEFLAAWLGAPAPTPPPLEEEVEDGSLSPLIPIGVIVLLGAVGAWLLLRHYRQADTRLAEDVRASVAPPREGPEPSRPDEGADRE